MKIGTATGRIDATTETQKAWPGTNLHCILVLVLYSLLFANWGDGLLRLCMPLFGLPPGDIVINVIDLAAQHDTRFLL